MQPAIPCPIACIVPHSDRYGSESQLITLGLHGAVLAAVTGRFNLNPKFEKQGETLPAASVALTT